ncbi:hypothetical protein F0L68_07385 [Solihabitans fulvus]|uniref:Uncharacterized protein n=1 Tax=Solihabitans fulvus TaxID=1892852 RepID=A0A5B2XMC0_9PSEU|nr:pentapeptide repeat-containing protein [Solihabitans fulvus]KAA2264887.1 hypothetical protein F0L68_07385 [Solihabitans fulvus]
MLQQQRFLPRCCVLRRVVNFYGAKFSGGEVDFRRAEFSGGEVAFYGAEFSGGKVDFRTSATWQVPPRFNWWTADGPPTGLLLPPQAPD